MDRLFERCGRRAFIRRLGGWGSALAMGSMLAACDDDGQRSVVAPTLSDDARRLNLALNIAYLGAEYHSRAVGAPGVPAQMTTGIGRPGWAMGVRAVSFTEPAVAAMANDVGKDKIARVAMLRERAGDAAAAMPTLDLSPAPGAAFTTVAKAARLVYAEAFDPYVSDDNFLLGASILEDGTAAAFRGLAESVTDPETSVVLDGAATDAIYHGALIRALIAQRSMENPALPDAALRVRMVLSEIGGTDIEGRTRSRTIGASNIDPSDLSGGAAAFVRSPTQALQAVLLNSGPSGGFLPYGANGTT